MAAPTGEVEVASQAKVKLTPIALAKEASELSAEERAEFLLALSEILGPVPSAHTLVSQFFAWDLWEELFGG